MDEWYVSPDMPAIFRPPAHLVVFSCEHLDAHDGEYQPEDEAHQEHVEDAGNRLDQGVDDDLLHEGAFSELTLA